jgi:Fe-S-cluster containining protein
MGNDCNICSNHCWGIEGYDGSCCSIEDRNYIIGPHHDTKDFIKRLSNKVGREIKEDDVFYTYETGRHTFPNKSEWQNPNNYPALKIDLNNTKSPCIFYNTVLKACTVYEIRPKTCAEYECEYLRNNT